MSAKGIALLGSTGSIGRGTLEVARHLGRRVYALAAKSNEKLMEEQAREFIPSLAVLYDESAARGLRIRLADTNINVLSGQEGLMEAALYPDAEITVAAMSGTLGLAALLERARAGRSIALANKEALVVAGGLLMRTARASGAAILPVDSEHSGVWQCVAAGGRAHVRRVILTASGGPFFGYTTERLKSVTPDDALRHPNWKMGPKITVDCATLMNKGLEVIEAMRLYDLPTGAVEVLIHRESAVHALVEFSDNSTLAQIAAPDMRLPIQYALTWPERAPSLASPLDLAAIGSLSFAKPDTDAFPCLRLAYEGARAGERACAALCGADEEAVAAFLAGKLTFSGIPDALEQALAGVRQTKGDPTLDELLEAEQEGREAAGRHIERLP